jgi:geranyl-CoA carboxylase alpha subunit
MSAVRPIKRLLVANRGEIACRIFKTARACGIETVAVYSDVDKDALHVHGADQAVHIGPPAAAESYLCGDKIITAALEAGADAIHPGYGFLSENADFARACEDAGLIFVGPSADAIALMGNKAAAKRHMISAGVPCVPGYEGEDQSDDAFVAAAVKIGFPIMVKAAAGGGGRGMRLVDHADGLLEALVSARSEAENAFGSDELILEKAIKSPRHVEIQVFGDSHGHVVHMGERDCSVQRRHQKVIEEAPCPVMTHALRAEMGAAAISAAQSIGYVGAGTVEFLLDTSGAFYFLEMNTRLQVEHPVTEMVTGLDLVALQLRATEGRPLGVTQADIALRGHAIEVRLYGEDPSQGFLPQTGAIERFQAPTGVRTDSGIASGQVVSPYYDPMLAKIVAHGETREEARVALLEALKETVLFGTKTNLAFLIACLEHPDFIHGEATTSFIAENFCTEDLQLTPTGAEMAIAAVLEHVLAQEQAQGASLGVAVNLRDWASASGLITLVIYAVDGEDHSLLVRCEGAHHYCVGIGEQHFQVMLGQTAAGTAQLHVDGAPHTVAYARTSQTMLHVAVSGRIFTFSNQINCAPSGLEAVSDGTVRAPMHGLLLSVKVSKGDKVAAGDCLAILEAMKMQHQIVADVGGTVEAVEAAEGTQVAAEQLLLQIIPDGEPQ